MEANPMESDEFSDILVRYIRGELSGKERDIVSARLRNSREDRLKYISLLEIDYVMRQGTEIGEGERETLLNLVSGQAKSKRVSILVEFRNKKFTSSTTEEIEINKKSLLSGLAFRGNSFERLTISKKIDDIQFTLILSTSQSKNKIYLSYLIEPDTGFRVDLIKDRIRIERVESTLESSMFETPFISSSNLLINFYRENLLFFSMQLDLQISNPD